MRHQKGFMLIEVLVVTSIIAILVAIAIPALSRGREAARKAEIRKLIPNSTVVVDDKLVDQIDKIKEIGGAASDEEALAIVEANNYEEIGLRAKRVAELQQLRPDIIVNDELIQKIDDIQHKGAKAVGYKFIMNDKVAIAVALGEDPTIKVEVDESKKDNPSTETAPSVTALIAAPGVGSVPASPVAKPAEAEAIPTPPADTHMPEMDAVPPEPVKVVGVILSKAEAHYGENGRKETIDSHDEYWFYVRKFDNSKSGLIFDETAPTWLRVDQKIFQAKEVAQTYDSTWQPEPEKVPEPKKEPEINNS